MTESVKIMVTAQFAADKSLPGDNQYVWAYFIQIENKRPHAIQLLRRSWDIVDAQGNCYHVEGEGVIGLKPVIKPGKTFDYMSTASLRAPSGIMTGHYEMVDDNGKTFQAEIPAFSLDSPFEKAKMN